MRKLLIAGNWKMNTDANAARGLAEALAAAVGRRESMDGVEIAVCPPFVNLAAVKHALAGTGVGVGAQNMSDQPSGAYTGEISADMLLSVGCELVILGHSERRQYFRETDADVNAKCHAAQKSGLRPIVCVGEQLAERQKGEEKDVVAAQLGGSLDGLDPGARTVPVIAYEPVWAIGTGHTATPEQAQEMHRFIRELLDDMWGEGAAQRTQVLYGGSMKPNNARELLSQPDIDGGLIGGASLDAGSFLAIIDAGLELA